MLKCLGGIISEKILDVVGAICLSIAVVIFVAVLPWCYVQAKRAQNETQTTEMVNTSTNR